MAFLIPENIATSAEVPSSLQAVARYFRDDLGDDVTVWLEGTGGDREHQYLVVLDPVHGVLLVGAPKGGARAVSGIKEIFESLDTAALKQVAPTLGARIAEAGPKLGSEEGSVPLAIKPTLAFPTVEADQAVRLGFTPQAVEQCLFEGDFAPGGLEVALKRLLGGEREPLTEPEEGAVRAVLYPDIVIDRGSHEDDAQLVFTSPSGNEDIVRVLDRQQERLARDLGGGYRVVRGVAGSGKTLVLTFRARFLAEKFPSWRILLTCFNICLAKALEAQLADLPNVAVRHIDSHGHFVRQAARIKFARLTTPDDWNAARIATAQALKKDASLREFDAVLVDEGQDFDSASFDIAYYSMKEERDHFVVALDAAQNIYRKASRWSPPDQTARGRTSLLKTNYRNTREILNFAHWFLTNGDTDTPADQLLDDPGAFIPPEASLRRGPVPAVVSCKDPKEEATYIVGQLIKRHAEGTPWSQMLVLFGQDRQDSWQTALYRAASAHDVPYFRVSWKGNKRRVVSCGDVVRSSNVASIKGLEFTRVFMCGVNDMSSPDAEDIQTLRKLIYVGMTRATDELTITISGAGDVGAEIVAANARGG